MSQLTHISLKSIAVKSKARVVWPLYCSHVSCMQVIQESVCWWGLERGPA